MDDAKMTNGLIEGSPMSRRANAAQMVAGLLPISLGVGVLAVRYLTPSSPAPPPSILQRHFAKSGFDNQDEAAAHPQALIQRFDFGTLLLDGDEALERTFTFTNDSPHAITIRSLIGQPSCCVQPVLQSPTEVTAGERFSIRVVIKPNHKHERTTWRAIATAASGFSFVAEATADLTPVLSLRWDAESAAIATVGESMFKHGVVSFVGSKPPTDCIARCSHPGVRWTLGEWDGRGAVAGTTHLRWEAPVRGQIVATKPGRFSSTNCFEVKPSGHRVSFTWHWTVPSSWKLEPKSVALSPDRPNGRFALHAIGKRGDARPNVVAPPSLNVASSRTRDGWEFAVSASGLPRQVLESITLQLNDEEFRVPIDLAAFRRSEGGR
jgi:hypothetical protein